MSSAVLHCHANNVIHLDIKAQNFLLDYNSDIKLSDFGLSVYQGEGIEQEGDCAYLAPEILNKRTANFALDYFSLGLCIF